MPQNTKDTKGGKSHPAKNTSANGGKVAGTGKADKNPRSPAGSHNKGEKKTTP